METFSTLLALCEGNPPVTSGFPSQSQLREVLVFSFVCAWTNGWANHWDAGDLRRDLAHYDITVMIHDDFYLSPIWSEREFGLNIGWSLWSLSAARVHFDLSLANFPFGENITLLTYLLNENMYCDPNPSGTEIGIFRDDNVNKTSADALAPCVVKPSVSNHDIANAAYTCVLLHHKNVTPRDVINVDMILLFWNSKRHDKGSNNLWTWYRCRIFNYNGWLWTTPCQ